MQKMQKLRPRSGRAFFCVSFVVSFFSLPSLRGRTGSAFTGWEAQFRLAHAHAYFAASKLNESLELIQLFKVLLVKKVSLETKVKLVSKVLLSFLHILTLRCAFFGII